MVDKTQATLREFGRHGLEGFCVWLGSTRAAVEQVLVPPQRSISSESGVGYFLEPETLFQLNRFLSTRGLKLIAQVHSHPGHAYHSVADDEYAIATKEGSLSLVVPDFARGPADLRTWAVYRLTAGQWIEVPRSEVERQVVVT